MSFASPRFPAALVVMCIALATSCGGLVRPRDPSPSPLPPDLLASPAIAELVGAETAPGKRGLNLISPDGRYRLTVVSTGLENFHGVELQRDGSLHAVPVLSFWECDPRRRLSLESQWARDSSAIRLTGCATGFVRPGNSRVPFDLLYVPDRDAFYELRHG